MRLVMYINLTRPRTETEMTPKIETRLVADLIPYASNSRTHSDAQVAQIAASIKEFGWTNPILIVLS